ncbi:hypothetical protein ACFQX7_12580 [Luedemannella flava]
MWGFSSRVGPGSKIRLRKSRSVAVSAWPAGRLTTSTRCLSGSHRTATAPRSASARSWATPGVATPAPASRNIDSRR